MGVLPCPAPLVHARALGQHAKVEAEQLVQILGSYRVVLAAHAVHEVHASCTLALRVVLVVQQGGAAACGGVPVGLTDGLGQQLLHQYLAHESPIATGPLAGR
ncbi:hypothetical protein D9M70_599350 [compost metagenome]